MPALYENLAPHFKLSVQPVDDGILVAAKTYNDHGEVESEYTKIVVDTDELRAEIAKLFV